MLLYFSYIDRMTYKKDTQENSLRKIVFFLLQKNI